MLGSEYIINVKENRRGNQEWTIQRNWQHWVYKTQDEDKQNKDTKHNMCWTPLCVKYKLDMLYTVLNLNNL